MGISPTRFVGKDKVGSEASFHKVQVAQAEALGYLAMDAGGYSVQRLKTSEPLVPPKPKEFDRA